MKHLFCPKRKDVIRKTTFSPVSYWWPIFFHEFKSTYKSIWLGWLLITWRVDPDWWLLRIWPIVEFHIDFKPKG